MGLLSTPLFFFLPVHASDQNDQENVNNQARDDTVLESNGTAFVHSTVQQKNIENTYGLTLSSTNKTGIALHIESSDVNDIRQVANPANPSIRISYTRIIEFNDTNGNGAYDPGQDQIIQSINLQTLDYASPEILPIVSPDGKQGYELTSRTIDGLFTVSTMTYSQPVLVDSTAIPPTTTSISVNINTSKIHLDPTSSGLALETVAISSIPFQTGPGASVGSLTVKSGTTQQYFTWSPTITIDNRQAQVKLSGSQTSTNATVNLSYPKGASITQNMLLGVIFGPTPLLTTALLIGSSIAALILFSLLFTAGRRQYSRARGF